MIWLIVPDFAMERTDLLIAFLAFGAAFTTLMAWLWASMVGQPSSR